MGERHLHWGRRRCVRGVFKAIMSTKRADLLNDPVGPTLLRLAGPMALGFIAVILFSVVDTFWVGRLGSRELAAMSFTFPVIFLVMSIAVGMGVGMTSVVSRAIGRGDTGRVCRFTTDGLLLANTLVVLVAAAGLSTIGPVFETLGASPDIVTLIRRYMVPWYMGIGFIVIPIVGNAAIRATGDTKTPSLIMMIAGGVNMVLDPLLIFGVGPFPRLELQGAAIATVIAYAITFIAAFVILWKRERMLEFARPTIRDLLDSWRQILYIAVPAAGTQMPCALGYRYSHPDRGGFWGGGRGGIRCRDPHRVFVHDRADGRGRIGHTVCWSKSGGAQLSAHSTGVAFCCCGEHRIWCDSRGDPRTTCGYASVDFYQGSRDTRGRETISLYYPTELRVVRDSICGQRDIQRREQPASRGARDFCAVVRVGCTNGASRLRAGGSAWPFWRHRRGKPDDWSAGDAAGKKFSETCREETGVSVRLIRNQCQYSSDSAFASLGLCFVSTP